MRAAGARLRLGQRRVERQAQRASTKVGAPGAADAAVLRPLAQLVRRARRVRARVPSRAQHPQDLQLQVCAQSRIGGQKLR